MTTFREAMAAGRWPAISVESVAWESTTQGGLSRRAVLRARGPYNAAVPASIGELDIPTLSADLTVAVEDAVIELTRFDAEVGTITAPFSAILLRSESAASSEIEQLTASAKSVALAELGRGSGANSKLIVGNVRAMEAAIEMAEALDEATIIRMQAEILGSERPEHIGRWRDQPVWIGGGYASSPHTAVFVPPRHERVPELMRDLVRFARRTDLPALPQVAIAHAQFETVHPFPDGNGRTGRALVQAMLNRLGVTRNVTVPVSAGLLRDTSGYFDALTAYRAGDIEPIIGAFADASAAAIVNGRQLVSDLTDVRLDWASSTKARLGSAARRLLEILERQPVIDTAHAAQSLGISTRNAQNGIDRLIDDGILRQIGGAQRGRVFEAPRILEALDAFAARAKRPRLH